MLFGDSTKILLWQLLVLMTGLLIACGWLSEMGPLYDLIAVGGAVLSLGLKVDLKNAESCWWWWFGNGFWFAGGLLAKYAMRRVI